MNERRNGSFGSKRKTGLHLNNDRNNVHLINYRPHNAYFGKERNTRYSTGLPHSQRTRSRGFNGPPSYRSVNFRGNFNRYAPQQRGNSQVLSTRPKQILSKPNSTPLKQDSPNDQPATFVCEGIEVNFDSSDSDEEVCPWKVVQVLRKDNDVGRKMGQKDEVTPMKNVVPRVRGTILRKPDMNGADDSNNSDTSEVQVLGSTTSDPIIVPQTSPSYVVLSGLRKREGGNSEPMRNCAIIKRPAYLLPQQVPAKVPTTRTAAKPRVSLLSFQDSSQDQSSLGEKQDDFTQKEWRVIEDVLDMTEEVERRAKFLNYRYS